MMRAIRKSAPDLAAVFALLLVAVAVSGYILENQRLRFPIIEDKPLILRAAMSTGQAVTPGQGQTVRVSGVYIGDIAGVELEDGRAIVTMEIDRRYEGLVREDAFALLRPKTGLKDMFVELMPGSKDAPVAREGYTIPVSNTLPDVNPDEFLSALDSDTRDYLKLLLHGAARGLDGRADDLNDVLKRFEPTYRDIELVSGEVAGRRRELRRLITSLNKLNGALATKDRDLTELVSTASQTFQAFADEREGVSATIHELPEALRETSLALERVNAFAEVLGPSVTKLRPAVRSLDEANRATQPAAEEIAPLLARDIRPFVREARPLVRELRPGIEGVVAAEPDLKRTVRVLNRLFNMLAYNPEGAEPATKAGRDEGYLFHLAWLAHISVNLFSGSDAHGPFRPLVLGGTCAALAATANSVPGSENLLGLTGPLTDPAVCGAPEQQAAAAREARRAERAGRAAARKARKEASR